MGSGGAQVLKLNRADFEEYLESELRAMTDDSIGLQRWLATVPLLQGLAPEVLTRIATAMEAVAVPAGEAIISIGEPGDAIYFVERGGAEVEVGGATVMSYSRGDYFGELALLTDEPRRATVRAGAAGVQVLKLNREAFDETLQERLRGKNEGETVEEYRCLSIAPLLHSLAPEVRARIAEAMELIEIEANRAIITVGEPGDAIYFLEHGSAQAEVDGAVVRSYKQGSHFGELAFCLL